MRARALLLAVVLVAVGLTGCLGGDEDADEPLQKERADVTERQGGIQGVVTDNAVQPVVGANVTVEELGQTTQTASDGSYAFSKLDPGSYTLVIRADGFVTTKESVTVEAGEVAVVDVLLTHLTSQEAYMQQHELVGFVECGVGWSVEPTRGVVPLTTASLAACAVPNFLLEFLGLGGNATNDKFLHNFELEAPIETMVYEMTWESQDAALLSIIEVQGFPNDDEALFWVGGGSPPLYAQVDKPIFQNVSQNFTEACAGTNDTEQDDSYCGFNFWDNGWPLWTRVFAHWDCNDIPARACPIIQEEFTHFVSAFYNAPAPEGFAVIDGNGP